MTDNRTQTAKAASARDQRAEYRRKRNNIVAFTNAADRVFYPVGPAHETMIEREREPVSRFALLTTVSPQAFAGAMPTTPEAVQAAKRNHEAQPDNGDAMLKRSPDSAAMVSYWDQTDAIIEGVEAVRLQAEKFLPRFTEEDEPDYRYRLQCTKMTNVYRDAVEGLAAKPFEKEVELSKDIPQPVIDFIEDVDGSGNNLTVYSSQVFFSGINSAIHWIFVDHPPLNPAIRSVADVKAAGVRPYWSHVIARNVLEASVKVTNGKEMLNYIRIFEPGSPDHIRIFMRDEVTEIVTWQVWIKTLAWHDMPGGLPGRTQFIIENQGVLTIKRIPLVPFITGRRDGRTFKLLPALRDAADLQVNIYQNESGLEFVKRLAAYPMLAGNGVKPPVEANGQVKKLAVGPGRTLYAPPDGNGASGTWTYVEPSATSLTFLANDIKATIEQLRELGRQPLVATMGITVVQAGMAAGKARSAVKAWALGLKDALENAMVLTCMFLGIDAEPTVEVFTEFDEFAEGKDLDALNAMRAKNDISRETLWDEMKRRKVLSDEFDPDEETARLLAEVPADTGLDTNPNDPAVIP